jgi:hypothetical protein
LLSLCAKEFVLLSIKKASPDKKCRASTILDHLSKFQDKLSAILITATTSPLGKAKRLATCSSQAASLLAAWVFLLSGF